MVTVTLRSQLHLNGVRSLKEKRRILKSLVTRIHNDFNVSVAEVGSNDSLKFAEIGAAIVSNSGSFGQQVISKVVSRIESTPEVFLADYQVESF